MKVVPTIQPEEGEGIVIHIHGKPLAFTIQRRSSIMPTPSSKRLALKTNYLKNIPSPPPALTAPQSIPTRCQRSSLWTSHSLETFLFLTVVCVSKRRRMIVSLFENENGVCVKIYDTVSCSTSSFSFSEIELRLLLPTPQRRYLKKEVG